MNKQPASSSVQQTPSLVRVASDELLMLGARLHDDVALGVLYDRYGAEAYGVALETLRESDAAEAATQDAFLRIWRGVEIYDASLGSTRDWLIGIARGRALNALARLEPFGGVPEQMVSLDDTGLLAPAEPSSGARDRLLARARAEGGGARAAEAPTVVIPAAELGPEPEASLADDAPTVETWLAFDAAPTVEANLVSDEEQASVPDDLPTVETKLTSDAVLAPDAGQDGDAELALEAPTLTGLPIPEPPTLNGQHTVVNAEVVAPETTIATDLVVDTEGETQEVELASGAVVDAEAVAPETMLATETFVDAEAVTQEATLPTDLVVGEEGATHEAAPPTDAAVDTEGVTQEMAPVTGAVVDAEVVAQEVVPVTDEVVDTEGVTQAVAAMSATDVAAEDADKPEPPARKPAELEPSEALAAALAPIPPRRPQQRKGAPEAPRKRRIKLASIGWGAALMFVVASGLSVTAWSATAPHLSPDLNVLSRLPGGRIVVLRGPGTPPAIARLHSVDSGRRAELMVESLPALPNGRVYQVWLIEPGQAARGGGAFFVNRRGDAIVPMSLGGPVERFQMIAITQEPAPGTTAPTGSRILEGTP